MGSRLGAAGRFPGMTVRVRLFAMLRERAGRDVVELELPDGASVGDALAALQDVTAGVTCVLAVNRDYADAGRILVAGDELALIPPVSGGSLETGPHVAVRPEPLSLDALVERVRDPRAGAVVTFAGVTRDVDLLEYEAYAEMALEAMREIVHGAIELHGLCAAAAEHRLFADVRSGGDGLSARGHDLLDNALAVLRFSRIHDYVGALTSENEGDSFTDTSG